MKRKSYPIYSDIGIIGEMKEDNSDTQSPIINNNKKKKSTSSNKKKKDNNDTIDNKNDGSDDKKLSNKKKHKRTTSTRKPHGRKPPIEDLGVKPPTKDKSTYSIYDDHIDTDING